MTDTELRIRVAVLEKALGNVYLLAKKYRNGAIGVGGVEDLLRFCKEAGFTSSPLRAKVCGATMTSKSIPREEFVCELDHGHTGLLHATESGASWSYGTTTPDVCQHTLDANETCGCRAAREARCADDCVGFCDSMLTVEKRSEPL